MPFGGGVGGPLSGIRVLDLSRVVAGPSCTRTLVELGADVIKLEPPDGDLTRKGKPRVDGVALYYAQQNAGKRCVSVDLGTEEGRRIGFELAVASDAVVENFRPGVADRLGLGYEAVRARHPRIVYCSISGYGQSGSAADRRAYAPVVHAEMGLTEFGARKRGAVPAPEPVSHVDFAVGMQGAIALCAALFERERTGVGSHVEASMAETMLATNEWTSTELVVGDEEVISPFGGFRAPVITLADGTSAVVAGDPAGGFRAWARAMDAEDLLDDPRFATREACFAHRDDVLDVIGHWAATVADYDTLEELLYPHKLVAGRVRSLGDAVSDDWVDERGAIYDAGAGPGAVPVPRSPIRSSTSEVGLRGIAAHQGAHNAEVLADVLQMSDDEIGRLTDAGVLVERRVD